MNIWNAAEDCSFARNPTTMPQELKPSLTCVQTLYTDKTTESHIPPHHTKYISHLQGVYVCFSLPAPCSAPYLRSAVTCL